MSAHRIAAASWLLACAYAPSCASHYFAPASPDVTGGREIDDSPAARQQQAPPRLPRAVGEDAITTFEGLASSDAELAAPGGRVGAIVRAGNRATFSPPAPGANATTHARASVQSGAGGDALIAARMAWIEGGWSLADAAAVVHVIKRRAHRSGWTFSAMALRYSQLDGDSDRAAFARRLPWGDEPSWPRAWNERWSLVRAVARGALDGTIESPCGKRAVHWGARNLAPDVARATRAIEAGRWRRVRCATRVANAYFAEVRRVLPAAEAAGGR
jgi:hypothetical protein